MCLIRGNGDAEMLSTAACWRRFINYSKYFIEPSRVERCSYGIKACAPLLSAANPARVRKVRGSNTKCIECFVL